MRRIKGRGIALYLTYLTKYFSKRISEEIVR